MENNLTFVNEKSKYDNFDNKTNTLTIKDVNEKTYYLTFDNYIPKDFKIDIINSNVFKFWFCREFTFKSAANVPVAMLKVALFYVVFTPLSTWWMDYFTEHNINGYLVEGLTMVLNFVLEFLYCKFFVYRNSINTKQTKK